jgi:uncharacterized protein (TIGR02300 family)
VTGRKFYDMNKTPIVSPYTGQVVPIIAPVRGRAEPAAVRPAPVEEEVEVDTSADAELISLEEADDEAGGTKTAAGDDIEVEDDAAAEDDTFLEEDEDAGDDVTDLIGDGIEDDEEP